MKLNQDLLKTVGGLLLIGVIVVATFLYGNRQRQAQIRDDQTATEQSEQAPQTDENTPVEEEAPAPAAPAPTAPAAEPAPTRTPETGASDLIPLALLTAAYWAHRRSRRQLQAARATRFTN